MKKIFTSLLLIALIAILIVPASFAAGTVVTVSSETAAPGETVVLSVSMSGNTGFGSGKYVVSYDTSALTLTDLDVDGTLLSGAAVNDAKGVISFAKATSVTEDGVLFTATFAVSETAADGDYEVAVAVQDIVNAETKETLVLTSKAGTVTVQTPHVCSGTFVAKVDATCMKNGTEAHYVCDCGKLYTDPACTAEVSAEDLVIGAMGHSYGNWTVTTEPTCTEKGVETGTCVCGDTSTREVAAKGHSYGDWVVTKEAADGVEGSREKVCSGCGDTVTETLPALDHVHSYTDEVMAPTCTEQGYTTHTCGCGDRYVDTYVDALGHSYGDWTVTKEPTATEKGEKEKTCSVCGDKVTEEIDAASEAPKTGDESTVGIWFSVLLLSVAGIAVFGFVSRKKAGKEV